LATPCLAADGRILPRAARSGRPRHRRAASEQHHPRRRGDRRPQVFVRPTRWTCGRFRRGSCGTTWGCRGPRWRRCSREARRRWRGWSG